ncbi:MAG: hypothetical protein EHM12_07250 [Dehalococcoidia bacterium]|nr:MAG: hypothetical protein EHM12_07250 [Dehalococcoidia bacterium]
MELLTRGEEYVLLAIWRLQGEAYSVMIRREIGRISGRDFSLGSVFAPLERLEKKGLVTSTFTEATSERGGRRKRVYSLAPGGIDALREIKKIHESFWADLPVPSPEAENA